MTDIKFCDGCFRLDDGEFWYRFDGFYGYPAFAATSGLFDKMQRVRRATGERQDFAAFVAEHGVRPLLAPHVNGEVRLVEAVCGPDWARDDDPDAHYFEVYVKEYADYERLRARAADLDWPDIDDE